MAETPTAEAPKGGTRRSFASRLVRFLLVSVILGFVTVFALVRGAAYHYAAAAAEPIPADSADVIIVLSAGLTRGTLDVDPFTAARVERGIELWRAGAAPTLLMSGGVDLSTGQHLSERMKLYAMELGAPRQVVSVEGNSVSTFENARFTLAVGRQEGWRRAIVVSDDFHLMRASLLFEFWRRPSDMEIVSVAAADGRSRVDFSRNALVLFRETLAVPFNIVKVAGQLALEAIGEGDARTIR